MPSNYRAWESFFIPSTGWVYWKVIHQVKRVCFLVALFTIDTDLTGCTYSRHGIVSIFSWCFLDCGCCMDILHWINHVALLFYYLETPFFYFNLALIDNVTFEYSSTLPQPLPCLEKFTTIFPPIFAFGPSEFVNLARGWQENAKSKIFFGP